MKTKFGKIGTKVLCNNLALIRSYHISKGRTRS